MAPTDGIGGKRLQKDPAKLASGDFWPTTRPIVRLIHQNFALPVEHPRLLAAGVYKSKKRVKETGRLESKLPVFFMDIEHASLCADVSGGVPLINGGRDAMDVEYARQSQPPRPAPMIVTG
jgi:hypothetical protein